MKARERGAAPLAARAAPSGKAVPRAALDALVAKATEVRLHAYAPYSGYLVGAAALAGSGEIYAGCNVENASFGATVCAERNAIGALVAAGEATLRALALVTGDEGATPCGICRQVIAELGPAEMPVVMVGLKDPRPSRRVLTSADLLPHAFRLARAEITR